MYYIYVYIYIYIYNIRLLDITIKSYSTNTFRVKISNTLIRDEVYKYLIGLYIVNTRLHKYLSLI